MTCREEPIFRDIKRKVSHHALKMLLERWRFALDAFEHPGCDMACDESDMRQYGMPCWHWLYGQRLMSRHRAVIPLRMIHAHWHLFKAPLPENEAALLRIQDPAICPLRGSRKWRNRTRSHNELRKRRAPDRSAPLITIDESEEDEVLVRGTPAPQPTPAQEVIDLTADEPDTAREGDSAGCLERARQTYREKRDLDDLCDETTELVHPAPRRPRAPPRCTSCFQIGHNRRSRCCTNYVASSALSRPSSLANPSHRN